MSIQFVVFNNYALNLESILKLGLFILKWLKGKYFFCVYKWVLRLKDTVTWQSCMRTCRHLLISCLVICFLTLNCDKLCFMKGIWCSSMSKQSVDFLSVVRSSENCVAILGKMEIFVKFGTSDGMKWWILCIVAYMCYCMTLLLSCEMILWRPCGKV